MTTINEISQMLAKDAATVAEYLLPNGKRANGEWKAGSVNGEEGKSLSVRLAGAKAGIWRDFSADQGGDLIDLWSCVRGLSIAEALKEAKSFLNIKDEKAVNFAKTYKLPEKPRCQTPRSGVKEWLNGRGLTDETIAAFRLGEQLHGGKTYAVFPYLRDGELVNAKYRNVAEKKDMRQEGGAEPCLFGWHLIDPKSRTICITEGEIDAMTLHQIGFPAMSVNAGAGNHQWIESDWDRLERFSTILLCFDNDDAGIKAVKEVAVRLGIERCKSVTFGAKDANQWLQDGAEKVDFDGAIQDAKSYDPEELRSARDFMEGVKALFYPDHNAIKDPCLQLSEQMDWFHFRKGELTVWTGYNGHGKSLLLSQVLLGLMSQGERVVQFSGELTPERQLKRMAKQASGLDRPSREYIDAIGDWMSDRLWIYNQLGSATIKRLLEVFAYATRRYGVTHLVIDSLMMTDVPDDGAGFITMQKTALQSMCNFAKRHNVHVHLVAHPRKGADENKGPGKQDVAGSSKITDGADNVFTVWSANKDASKPDEEDKPDAKLELVKQRNGETQHKTLNLGFHKDSQQYTTNKRMRPVSYVPFSRVEVNA
jgi:twinkle protein